MKFLIPEGGKTLSFGKKLISLDAGEFETDDKELQELLSKARGVSKGTTKKPKEADK